MNCVKYRKSVIADSIVKPMEMNFSDQKVDFQCWEISENLYKTCLKCDSGSILIVKSSDSIVEPMENGPIVKKCTSKLADSIAKLDVFEENGSEKGPKWLQPL